VSTITKATVVLNNQSVVYTLRQNSRVKRSYRLVLSAEDGLVYESKRAPDLQKAANDVAHHKTWILQTLAKQQKHKIKAKPLKTQSQSVFILGREKTVRILYGQKEFFFLETREQITVGVTELPLPPLDKRGFPDLFAEGCVQAERLPAPSCKEGVRGVEFILTQILQARAKRCLPVWLKAQSLQHGFQYESVTVKEMKTQWGSCSRDKRIRLNWRLLMAPPAVRDYVIIHELAHTERMDHSAAFWQIVKKATPEFKTHKAWLKMHGANLKIKLTD